MIAARLPFPLLCLIAVVAGMLAALGFAPWDLWPLAVIGAGVLAALVDAAPSRRGAVLLGWLFGTGHFAVSFGWIAKAFTYQDKMPTWLGWVAVVGLAMFLAAYVGLAAGLTRWLARGAGARVLALAAFWMLGEWLRGWVLTGFAWNPLGAAWLAVPGIRQLAQFGGSLGLSGLLVLAGGGLWLLVRPGLSRAERRLGAGLVIGVALAGLAGTRLEGGGAPPAGPLVHLVQPNIGQDERYLPGAQEAHLRAYLALTAAALVAHPSPDGALIVWSEGSVPYLVEEEPEVRAALAAVLGPRDLLLFGGTAAFRDSDNRLVALGNTMFAIDARGALVARHDKAHLVPLGEYVPAKALMTAFGLARLVPGDLEFRPGPGPRTLDLPGFPAAGMQVCYEIIFPAAIVDRARRPEWIVNVSNDAWYGASGPPQHLAQARLRAIEEGLPIARATPTGVSAMIDGHGHVSGAIPLGTAGTSSVNLPPALPPTLFSRVGHLASLAFGITLLCGAWAWGRRRAGDLAAVPGARPAFARDI